MTNIISEQILNKSVTKYHVFLYVSDQDKLKIFMERSPCIKMHLVDLFVFVKFIKWCYLKRTVKIMALHKHACVGWVCFILCYVIQNIILCNAI